jgi:hypothetical protein
VVCGKKGQGGSEAALIMMTFRTDQFIDDFLSSNPHFSLHEPGHLEVINPWVLARLDCYLEAVVLVAVALARGLLEYHFLAFHVFFHFSRFWNEMTTP